MTPEQIMQAMRDEGYEPETGLIVATKDGQEIFFVCYNEVVPDGFIPIVYREVGQDIDKARRFAEKYGLECPYKKKGERA